MTNDVILSLETIEELLLLYQEKIKKLPDNQELKTAFNKLIQVRGTLYNVLNLKPYNE